MSDRSAWLSEWCPTCSAAPGARCADRWLSRTTFKLQAKPLPHLHWARGWRERTCRTCKAAAGEPCRTPTGRQASSIHAARLRPGRYELGREDVWAELERRGATVASVPFCGRAGAGGQVGDITLSRVDANESVDIERRLWRDELAFALEAPIWDRYGTFAGQPLIRATVLWTADDLGTVIRGERGGERFEEVVG